MNELFREASRTLATVTVGFVTITLFAAPFYMAVHYPEVVLRVVAPILVLIGSWYMGQPVMDMLEDREVL